MKRRKVDVWRDIVGDDRELTSRQKAVAWELANHANRELLAWPSVARLAERASVSRRTAGAAVQTLATREFLSVKWSAGGRPHVYTLTLPRTAQLVRGSEWATAQIATPNRANPALNRAAAAQEGSEGTEGGALERGRLDGAAPIAIEDDCTACGERTRHELVDDDYRCVNCAGEEPA